MGWGWRGHYSTQYTHQYVFVIHAIGMCVQFIHLNCCVGVLYESIRNLFIPSGDKQLPCFQFSPFPTRLQLTSWNISLGVF